MKIASLSGVLLISVLLSAQAKATIQCQADFSALQPGALAKVHIDDETKSTVSGSLDMNGALMNFTDAKVLDYSVRQDIDYSNVPEGVALNPGEARIAFIQSYLDDPDMQAAFKLELSFSLKDVASVRIYDLNGDALTNMMGGSPLVDLRDAQGALLGRFMQALVISPCQ